MSYDATPDQISYNQIIAQGSEHNEELKSHREACNTERHDELNPFLCMLIVNHMYPIAR